jgi:hypothetical protein
MLPPLTSAGKYLKPYQGLETVFGTDFIHFNYAAHRKTLSGLKQRIYLNIYCVNQPEKYLNLYLGLKLAVKWFLWTQFAPENT